MVLQLSQDWWIHRDLQVPPMRLLLAGWRPGMLWESRDQNAACDPFLRIYWNRTAGGGVVHEGRRIALRPDRLLAILPETPHRRSSTASADHFFIHAAFDSPGWRLPPGVVELPVDRWFRSAIDQILIAAPPQHLIERVASALVATTLCQLPLAEPGRDADLSLLSAALAPFARHPGGWPGTTALAQRLGWAERSLNRRFHQLCGQSPRAWIGSRRIDAACDQLAHGQTPIAEIAIRLGYGDRFHFSKAFRSARGLGPAGYRRLGLAR